MAMNPSSADRDAPSSPATGDFVVLINHEEQYGIWPANKPVPEKWRSVGMTGSKEECLEYVRRVWGDMRPLSIKARDRAKKAQGETA